MRKIKRILAVALSAATLFSLTACEKEENTATGEWTVETVYAKAQELGFEGTWEEFKEQMRGAQGVGIGDVGVSADGDLIVTLTSGKRINCGKVRLGACDHSYGAWQTGAAATCESIGYKMRACSSCGNVEYAFEAAKGHEWISAADVYENVYVCETCGLLKYSEEVPENPDEPENPDDSGESVDPTKTVLRISAWNGPNGVEWLSLAAEKFEYYYANTSFEAGKKGVQVVIETSAVDISQRIEMMPYDNNQIYFAHLGSPTGVQTLTNAVQSGLLKDITDVVTSPLTHFEETVSLGEKLVQEGFEADQKTYAIPYLAENYGILYNRDLFEEYEYEVPNTTEELFALCDRAKMEGVVPMISTTSIYTDILAELWWAQYEGLDGYTDFWNGVSGGAYSTDIFKQTGRLEALTAYETLVGTEGYFSSRNNLSMDFLQAQAKFLLSSFETGSKCFLMTFSGEWIMREMQDVLLQIEKMYNATPDIGMMKTPVLSSIVKTLEDTTMTDETLSAVIDAIDGGATSYTGVSASDFQKIQRARGVVSSNYEQFIVNNNVTTEQMPVVKEFLQFMSCDQALTEVTEYGLRTNYKFDLPTTVYDKLDTVRKDAYNIAQTANPLPDKASFPLYYYGGLQAWFPTGGVLFDRLWYYNKSKTAQEIFDESINYYTQSKFTQLLQAAGLMS